MSAAFDDFKQSLKPAEQAGVQALHEALLNQGCQAEIKEAKSGYTVSYLKPERKTLANFVWPENRRQAAPVPGRLSPV